MQLTIREAAGPDLNNLIHLIEQDLDEIPRTSGDFPRRSTRASLAQAAAMEEIFHDKHQQLLILEDEEGSLLAAAQLTWIRVLSADAGLLCQVEAIRVDRRHRDAGHGRSMIDHIERLAAHRKATRIQFSSHLNRPEVRDFYASLGYTASHTAFHKDLVH